NPSCSHASKHSITFNPSPALAPPTCSRFNTGNSHERYCRANSTSTYGGNFDRASKQNSSVTKRNALNETIREPTSLARFVTRQSCIDPLKSNVRHISGRMRQLLLV